MADMWYQLINGQPVGPLLFTDLQTMASGGDLAPTDKVSADGQTWVAASQVPGLVFGVLKTEPLQDLGYKAMELSEVIVTFRTVQLLQQTGKWVRLMSVMMFIGCGLICLVAAGIAIAIVLHAAPVGMNAATVLVYLAMGVIYIPPALYLNRYASKCKVFARDTQSSDLEAAVQAQKSFWKYVGILTIVVMCIYALVLPFVVIAILMMRAAATGAGAHHV